jgi:aspartate carbamoyltransferase
MDNEAMNTFHRKNFLSVKQLTKENISIVFQKADEMKSLVESTGGDDRLKGKILAALFYEPSSRTMSSFITAMQRLGGGFIPLNGMSNTSVAKGETLLDTAAVFSSYADIIAIRHPEVGSVSSFASHATVPVLNAGDGSGEHPTQALLDAYTISKHFADISSLTIGFVGDLKYGRTVHSLSQTLAILGVKQFVFVSPKQLQMPLEITQMLSSQGCHVQEADSLTETIMSLDVIYMTRVQKERFENQHEYEQLKDAYILDNSLMNRAKKESIVMHPLPRVGEIAEEVDQDPRALYFREEMRNGMYVRMALLDLILSNNSM